jgi:hypothetical protein
MTYEKCGGTQTGSCFNDCLSTTQVNAKRNKKVIMNTAQVASCKEMAVACSDYIRIQRLITSKFGGWSTGGVTRKGRALLPRDRGGPFARQ